MSQVTSKLLLRAKARPEDAETVSMRKSGFSMDYHLTLVAIKFKREAPVVTAHQVKLRDRPMAETKGVTETMLAEHQDGSLGLYGFEGGVDMGDSVLAIKLFGFVVVDIAEIAQSFRNILMVGSSYDDCRAPVADAKSRQEQLHSFAPETRQFGRRNKPIAGKRCSERLDLEWSAA